MVERPLHFYATVIEHLVAAVRSPHKEAQNDGRNKSGRLLGSSAINEILGEFHLSAHDKNHY